MQRLQAEAAGSAKTLSARQQELEALGARRRAQMLAFLCPHVGASAADQVLGVPL